MSSSHPELLPGGYPVTPQREETAENIVEYDQATGYNQPTPEHGKVAENITNNSPITSEYGNAAGENLENRKLDNNHDNSEYNFRNRKPEDDWENERPEDDLENRKPNDDLENRKPVGDWENRIPLSDWENRKPNDDLENRKPEGDWENRKPNDDLKNRKPLGDWEKKPGDWEYRKPNDNLENKKPEGDWENRKPNDDLENRKPEGDWENRKPEDNSKNRKPETENPEKSKDDKIREIFPLRFEPNSSSKEVTDKNDLAKVTNHGSSALSGIGINPVAFIGGGDKSPRHPYFEQKEKEISGGEKEAIGGDKEAVEGDKGAAEGEVDNSSTIKPSNIADQKTFDLTGDYNEQKEQEQIAEHKANVAQEQNKDKPSETHPQKQKSEIKKPERIDLGVKPLGGQQLPLPYKPEESVGSTDRAHQPQGETTEVHPEGPNAGTKITKKDKLNATINKAVGTFKQKIGKLTKNDNLVSKGTEKKAEAERTKEFGMRKEI